MLDEEYFNALVTYEINFYFSFSNLIHFLVTFPAIRTDDFPFKIQCQRKSCDGKYLMLIFGFIPVQGLMVLLQ